MTVATMPLKPLIPTTTITMRYRFCVRETVDSNSGQDVTFSQFPDLDLKWLRAKLKKQFGVPENRRIFYIDDDGDKIPIDSKCEFHEALKLAKNGFEMNNAITLIVGSFNVSEDEQYWMQENCCSDKENLRNYEASSNEWTVSPCFVPCRAVHINRFAFNMSTRAYEVRDAQSQSWKPLSSKKKPLAKQFKHEHDAQRKVSKQREFDVKQCDESNTKVQQIDEQTESKNTDTQRECNASLQCCSDALPPLWFTDYMESMKKDMVFTITNEVIKNVTKVLNKRLDSFAISPLKNIDQSGNQSGDQCSSVITRHPRCSLNSNEEKQKKVRSQDKAQSSDASFERTDEPRNANSMKNVQMKKDVIATITNEVVKEVTELLQKSPTPPVTSAPSKNPFQNQFPSHVPSSTSTSVSRLFNRIKEDNRRRKREAMRQEQLNDNDSIKVIVDDLEWLGWKPPQKATRQNIDIEQLSDNDSINVTVDDSEWYSNILENSTRQLQGRFDLIEQTFLGDSEKAKINKQNAIEKVVADNLSNDIGKEKEPPVRNNPFETPENFVSRKTLPQQNPKPSGERVYLEALKLLENEFRMNCSVNGHQMLDEGRLNRTKEFDNNMSENVTEVPSNNMTSFWSCNQEEKGEKEKEEDDDAFEIIQMPADDLFIPFRTEESASEQQNHDSNRDSPSFELLSEPPSPPCSIHLNEDHFSVNEEKLQQQASVKTNPNPVYVVDVHGKIFNDEHQTMNLDERVSIDFKKQPDVAYSFTMDEAFLTEDEDEETPPSKSTCTGHQSSERKSSRDYANGSYDDVKNSHASYLTVQTHCDSTQSQCSCQSQTDSGDFTQSFHSHTTSVTDTTDVYAHTYASKYGEQVLTAKDVQEAATTAAPRTNYDVRVNGGSMNEAGTNDKYLNNHLEYLCTPNCHRDSCPCTNPSFGASYQCYRANKSSDRSCSNVNARKRSASDQALLSTADSVHILPETLVSAAAQVGSFAYVTAREMFDKLRAHTEDPLRRRGGKCENKKPSVNHLPFY